MHQFFLQDLTGAQETVTAVRKDCNIPIAAGSTGTNDLIHYREFIMNGSVDILQPNVRDIGNFLISLPEVLIIIVSSVSWSFSLLAVFNQVTASVISLITFSV